MNRVTSLAARLYCAILEKKKAPQSHEVEPGMAQASLPLQCPSHCNSSKLLLDARVGSGHTNSPQETGMLTQS